MNFNPCNVVELIINELSSQFPGLNVSSPNIVEKDFADALISQIKARASSRLEVYEEICLDIDDQSDNEDELSSSQSTSQSSSQQTTSSSSQEAGPSKRKAIDLRMTDARRTEIAAYAQKYTFAKAATKFHKNKREIQAIVELERKGGSRISKRKKINDYCRLKFLQGRENGDIIHYWHIKSWALEKAREIGLADFRASSWWIAEFKRNNKIVSRKITRFTTRCEQSNEAEIHRKAAAFIEDVKRLITDTEIPDDFVFNTDQTRIEYEMVGNRTLSITGEKETLARVQNIFATTHSYTAQVMISKSGKLCKKLFLCLQETSGRFGPRVSQEVADEMEKFSNIYVDCSKSGKMERRNLSNFAQHVLICDVGEKNILLQDSFTGQSDSSIFTSAIEPNDLIIKTIPPKTTRLIQPLDVYFYRQYKILMRRIVDAARFTSANAEQESIIRSRKFVIRINALVHNQLSASIFQAMIRYAWIKSGYESENTEQEFENVLQVNFENLDEECSIENCEESAFIRCAHCTKLLCFNHFVISLHYHQQE